MSKRYQPCRMTRVCRTFLAVVPLVVAGVIAVAPGSASADPVPCTVSPDASDPTGVQVVVECSLTADGFTTQVRCAGSLAEVSGDRVRLVTGGCAVRGSAPTGETGEFDISGEALEVDVGTLRVDVGGDGSLSMSAQSANGSLGGSCHGRGIRVDATSLTARVLQANCDGRLRTDLGEARLRGAGTAAHFNGRSGVIVLLPGSGTASVDAPPAMVQLTCTPGITINLGSVPPIQVPDGSVCTVTG